MQNINSRRTILLVEEDHTVRRPLANRLRQFGYRVLVSADTEDAFEWTSGLGCIHADLILVNLVGKLPEEALHIGRRLLDHSRFDGKTPIVVMPESIPTSLAGKDERVTDTEWICYYEDQDQLERLVASLLHDPQTTSMGETRPGSG